jgi:hypothetical protein
MNLCSDGHNEVCYGGRVCPVCDIREDLEQTISVLESDITSLERNVDDLINEIQGLNAQLKE